MHDDDAVDQTVRGARHPHQLRRRPVLVGLLVELSQARRRVEHSYLVAGDDDRVGVASHDDGRLAASQFQSEALGAEVVEQMVQRPFVDLGRVDGHVDPGLGEHRRPVRRTGRKHEFGDRLERVVGHGS